MPFALDSNPSNIELSDSINYLLANFGANISADPNTGIITGPTGQTIGYLYQYLAIKYADSADGSLNFSNSPTNRLFYGIRNTNSTVESTNPADYLWQGVAGGFSTTKFLFYQTTGGRQVDFAVDTTNPTPNYVQDTGTAIDLDLLTAGKGRQVAYPTIYQWTVTTTPPTRPSTTTTFTWATGTYTAPAGWTSTPAIETNPGYYLWAITVPLSASPNETTSICDWTNVAYAIYNLSSNGAAGNNGLNFLNAYRVQSQSSPAPTFTSTTSGATIPAGWVGTAPAVAVGEVLWYIQGQYNSSLITINGVAANTTYWTGPIAASIFQDIRSDNWNGSNPPVAGTIATHGTAGYYIQRTTGDMYLNSVYGRGVARFDGQNTGVAGVTAAILANPSLDQNTGVEGYTNNTFLTSGALRAFNQSSGGGNAIYASHLGTGRAVSAQSTSGEGVFGSGVTGVQGTGTNGVSGSGGTGGYGVTGFHTSGGTAIFANGYYGTNNSTLVSNLYSQFAQTLVGTGGSNQLRFVSGTSTGSSAATFSGTKPGSASTNVWITMQIDSTTIYIPVWT